MEEKLLQLPDNHSMVVAFDAFCRRSDPLRQRDDELDALWTAFSAGYEAAPQPPQHPPVDRNYQAIAILAHETNRAWCAYLGDDSQLPWDQAPEWQQKSAINGVIFHARNPDAGDDASHNSWMDEKLSDGWVYGETKDPEAKTHPCLVPFDELSPEQQFKDKLFHTIARTALDMYAGHGGLAIEHLVDLGEFMINTMGYEPGEAETGITESVKNFLLQQREELEALRSASALAGPNIDARLSLLEAAVFHPFSDTKQGISGAIMPELLGRATFDTLDVSAEATAVVTGDEG